jgi:colicin import membrane protein
VAVRTGPAMASWIQQITARIQRAWIRPPSARPGIDCTLNVTQVPGGEIVSVKLGSCNGDDAVRESIEAAAYRASPLPPPPDPALFERDLEIHFRPTD